MKHLSTNNFRARRVDPRRRGTILIVTIVVCFTMAMVALVLCRTTAVEVMASANDAALIQAEAIERGAEQYAIGLLAQVQSGGPPVLTLTEEYFAGIQVGDGYFWILRPNYDDQWMPAYGFVDECSKVDINRVAGQRIIWMQEDLLSEAAPAIQDWRTAGGTPQANGAKSDYYLTLPQPYYCKEALFESVEELLLVRGMTPEILYGDGTAPPLGQTSFFQNSGALFRDATLSRGLFDLFTIHARSGTNPANPDLGRINVNTAPREVLRTLVEGDDARVDSIIAYRSSNFDFGTNTSSAWVNSVAGGIAANQICGESLRYSADICAVSGNGRAFKRVRIVIDSTQSPPTILFRRDMTERGWPMDPGILTSIRNGTWAK